ncbi:MAG: hypothetical protein HKN11_19705 [Rhizobiales bacterium]|nr:hypothetical protein [Hyphomicrobiales bacterium]
MLGTTSSGTILKAACRRLLSCEGGNVAILFSITIPAMVIAAGIAGDYINMSRQKTNLQVIADAAAIAGARESMLADADEMQIVSAATSYASSNLAKIEQTAGPVGINVTVANEGTVVSVSLAREWKPYFASLYNRGNAHIGATATATLVSAGKTCVFGMQENLIAAVHLDDSAKLTANDCGVYSNSSSSWSLRVDSNAMLKAEWICTVGGYGGLQSSQIDPVPTTDCPASLNPLSDRIAPINLSCDYVATVIVADTTLQPGSYCGGLIISGTAKVQLEPGTYKIEGGPLLVQDGAELTGKDVGFFLADELALFQFFPDTTISLEAPETGPLAGLLFFENPKNSLLATPRVHIITSNNARKLLGTFYLPRSVLLVDAVSPVADQSAYTAIVALRLWLREGPHLVLNSDYASTPVPVPKGLVGRRVVLSN